MRVTVVCEDGESMDLAITRIMTTFDLHDGNGRLKNMLPTKKHMPPRVLINCVVRAAACSPIVAEIQVYLSSIKKLADLQHRYYEIRRASSFGELLAEAESARAGNEPESDPQPTPISKPNHEPTLPTPDAPPTSGPCVLLCT